MNTNTLQSTFVTRPAAEPLSQALNKVMTFVVLRLNALDKALRARQARAGTETADLLLLADAYESTQPSYAADLRAAAMRAQQAQETGR
jgi:hypothetical protein